MMPLTITLAHKLNAAMAAARRDGSMGWLRPDSKTQVTVEYKKEADGSVVPIRVDTVVISTQHSDDISTEQIRKEIKEKIIKGVIPANLLDDRTIYHVCVYGTHSISLECFVHFPHRSSRPGALLSAARRVTLV